MLRAMKFRQRAANRQLLFQLFIEGFPLCVSLTERPLNGSGARVHLGREAVEDALYQLELRTPPRLWECRNDRLNLLIRDKCCLVGLFDENIAKFKPPSVRSAPS